MNAFRTHTHILFLIALVAVVVWVLFPTATHARCERSPATLCYNVWGIKKGATGSSGACTARGSSVYSSYQSPERAIAGFFKLINNSRYYLGPGQNTILGISSEYVKPDAQVRNANSNTWAQFVSTSAGIPANAIIPRNPGPGILTRLMAAIAAKEHSCNPFPYSYAQIAQGYNIAFGTNITEQQLVAELQNVANLNFSLADYRASIPTGQGLNGFAGGALGNLWQGLGSSLPGPISRFLGLMPAMPSATDKKNTGGSSQNTQRPPILDEGSTSKNPLDESVFDDFQMPNPPRAEQSQPPSPLITNKTPTLLCLPSPVEKNEQVLIMWACNDESHKAVGEGFDTQDAVIGTTVVRPQSTQTYGVTCVDDDDTNTQSSCTVDVVSPASALIATPRVAPRGTTISLAWNTKEVEQCALTSPDFPSFVREGRSGDVVSPTLFETTNFSLACETHTGRVLRKEVRVEVQ